MIIHDLFLLVMGSWKLATRSSLPSLNVLTIICFNMVTCSEGLREILATNLLEELVCLVLGIAEEWEPPAIAK